MADLGKVRLDVLIGPLRALTYGETYILAERCDLPRRVLLFAAGRIRYAGAAEPTDYSGHSLAISLILKKQKQLAQRSLVS